MRRPQPPGVVARRWFLRFTCPTTLPVSAHSEEIREALNVHQVVVVCGETGSGKTTQLPKLCLAMGRGRGGQHRPHATRRIAARSVAGRIAEEIGSEPGRLVGYKVRFSDQTGEDCLVKVMTDGILLAEIQHDDLLWQYDTLIVDEAPRAQFETSIFCWDTSSGSCPGARISS